MKPTIKFCDDGEEFIPGMGLRDQFLVKIVALTTTDEQLPINFYPLLLSLYSYQEIFYSTTKFVLTKILNIKTINLTPLDRY